MNRWSRYATIESASPAVENENNGCESIKRYFLFAMIQYDARTSAILEYFQNWINDN